MKKFLMAAAVALLGATSAQAADMAARPYTKAPPIAVAMYNWSGFYVGINGGGASSRKCWDIVGTFIGPNPPTSEGCHDATGGTVGGQVGYRWQSAAWVFGVEAQGNWANLRGSNLSLVSAAFGTPFLNNRSKIDALGLFTAQVGYSWNNMLVYVKGGAAVTNDTYEGFLSGATAPLAAGAIFDRASETRWGGVVGVGAEYGFAPNWSFALEYDHLFMGERTVTTTAVPTGLLVPVGSPLRDERIRQDVDMVTARINYRFGGPIVAKY
jgi:outer membrane immunogenic protein